MTITSVAQFDFVCDTIAERDSVTQFGSEGWRCFVKDDGTANGRSYVLTGGVWISSQPSGAGGGPHTHPESEVTNLVTDLSGKAASTHAHDYEPANANIQSHISSAHAPSNAQANADITKAEIEAKLIGEISSHSHAGGGSALGVVDDLQISILQTDGTLNAASGVQTWCGTNKAAQDVFTVEANTTYKVRGQLYINTGATTHTTAMAWALATATVTSFQYQVLLWSAALNAIATVQSTTHVSGVASKVLNATSTAVYTNIIFEGVLVIGTGGTITPQINFSANPTGTNLMKAGSWISFSKIGANSFVEAGGWA